MVERFGLNKKELNRIKKLSIPQQIAEINSMLDGMGVTEEAINKMGSTTLGYWAQIGERADKFKRTIGGMGNSKIGEVLGDVVAKLDSIDLDAIAGKVDAVIGGAVQKFIDFGKTVWNLRTPILAVGKAVGTFLGVVGGIVLVVKTIGLIGAAFGFLVSPIGIAALAIIGIGAAFKAAYEKSEPFRKAIDGIGQSFKAISKIFNGEHKAAIDILEAAGFGPKQIDLIRKFGYGLKDAVAKVSDVFAGVSNILAGNKVDGGNLLIKAGLSPKQFEMVNKFAYGLRGAFDKVMGVFGGLGSLISTGDSTNLLAALGFSPEAIAGIFAFVETVKTKVGEFVTYLSAKWTELQPGIASLMNAFSTAKDFVVNVLTSLWGFVQPVIYAFGVALGILADIAIMVFNNVIAPGVSRMMTAFQTAWSVISPTLELMGVAFGITFGLLKIAWDTILQPFVEFLLGGFKSAFEKTEGILESIGAVFDWVGERISGVVDWFSTVVEAVKSFKVPDWLSRLGGGGTVKFESNEGDGSKGKSHYHGIDYVPYDGYQATLHRGEKIVTAQDNRAGRTGSGGGSFNIAKLADQIIVREDADIDRIAEELYEKINAAAMAGA